MQKLSGKFLCMPTAAYLHGYAMLSRKCAAMFFFFFLGVPMPFGYLVSMQNILVSMQNITSWQLACCRAGGDGRAAGGAGGGDGPGGGGPGRPGGCRAGAAVPVPGALHRCNSYNLFCARPLFFTRGAAACACWRFGNIGVNHLRLRLRSFCARFEWLTTGATAPEQQSAELRGALS